MTQHDDSLARPSAIDEASACVARLGRLRNLVTAERLGGALVARPEHLRYLAGWAGGGGPATLVVADGVFLVTPAGSGDEARLEQLEIEAVPYVAYDPQRLVDPVAASREAAVALLRKIGLRGRVAVEPDQLSFAIAASIPDFEPIDVGSRLAEWRRLKDPFEQAVIRRSVAALERGFDAAREAIRPGLRELDLFAALESAVSEAAGSPVRLESNLGSGPRAALDDPHQTERTIEIGDIVLIDLYPAIDGYVADLTRNFVVGPATAKQRDRHQALELALTLGAERLRPGVVARDIDRLVRDDLQRLMPEHAASMTHHTGHGIGLQPWEDPWIGHESELEIEAGMVVAIEPGLYLPGVEGMRLEGNFLVTAAGAERLDSFPSTLIECAA